MSKPVSPGPVDRLMPAELNTPARMRASFDDGELFKSQNSIVNLLRDRLEALVALPRRPGIYSSFRELVFAFEADWKLLEERRREWMQLLQTVVRIVSDADQEQNGPAANGARQIENDWRSELLAGLAWPITMRSQLEARLSPLPLPESQRILSENIREVVKAMAEHMAFQLDTLVERCVLGEIEWHGDSACQYSFVDRGLHSYKHRFEYLGDIRVDHEQRVARRTVLNTISANKTLTVHVHDLVDAVRSPVSLAMTAIPKQASQVIDDVPEFLHQDLRVVEGNLIRQRCIQQDQGVDEWTVGEDVTVPYHFDPAIVLGGRYVLIGWLNDPNERTAPPVHSTSILASATNWLFK